MRVETTRFRKETCARKLNISFKSNGTQEKSEKNKLILGKKSPPTDTNYAKDYRSYVLSTSTIFVVDNVKLYVKNTPGGKNHKIHLDCPCCNNGTVEPYTNIGEHLRNQHDVTHISCPGIVKSKIKETIDQY